MKNLKKTIILIIAVFAILSCKKDEPVDNSWVYGKWYVTHVKGKTGEYLDVSILENYAQFNSDGSYKSYMLGDNYSGTYSVSGNTITALVGSEKVIYDVLKRDGNLAEAKMYYMSDPEDILYFKIERK